MVDIVCIPSSTKRRGREVVNRRTGVMTAIGAVLTLALAACETSEKKDMFPNLKDSAAKERLTYQTTLNHANNRVPGNFVTISAGDRRAHLVTDKSGLRCSSRCAAATPVGNDSYEVSVPVGFIYRPGSYQVGLTVTDKSYTLHKITKLTYWDPYAHAKRTVTATPGLSVTLPSALMQYTIANLTRAGMSGFIQYSSTIEVGGHTYVSRLADITAEPSSPFLASALSQTVPIVRTERGLAICLPKQVRAYLYLTDSRFKPGQFQLPVTVRHDC